MLSPSAGLGAAPRISTGSSRLIGIDAARGLAVVTMVVAHTSPSAIDLPAEYLTAPLFGLLIGVSLQLAWARTDPGRPGAARGFIVANLLRGIILVVLGIALSHVYGWVDVVLQVLGLLIMALAPLVVLLRRRPGWALVGAVALWLVSPLLMTSARAWVATLALPYGSWREQLLSATITGPHYRLISHLVFGLAGVALAGRLPRSRRLPWVVAGLAGVTVAAYGIGHLAGGAAPYRGDHAEILGSTAFAAGATLACVWAAGLLGTRSLLLEPLVSAGRLALSAYAAQLLLLAALAHAVGPTWVDDQWWVLGTTLVVCVGGAVLWTRVVRRLGPLEWLVRLPRRLDTGARAPAP